MSVVAVVTLLETNKKTGEAYSRTLALLGKGNSFGVRLQRILLYRMIYQGEKWKTVLFTIVLFIARDGMQSLYLESISISLFVNLRL